MYATLATPDNGSADRLGVTLFLAVIAHAAVIFGVSFAPNDEQRSQFNTLDIVLVQHRTEEAPEEADFLAQSNQDAGGEVEERVRPTTPLPATFAGPELEVTAVSPPVPQTQPLPPTPEVPVAEPEPERAAPTAIIAQIDEPTEQTVAKEPAADPDIVDKPAEHSLQRTEPLAEALPTQSVDAATLVSRSLEIASLSAEIDRKLQAYAERPRRKMINARTREFKYASYMDAWRAKVERIGNLNYPDEARRRGLSGNLLLEVALQSDGSVNEVILRRSSGQRVLDDAAIRIVTLAAPYAPFPADIREETDILHIVRTWQFLNSNRLSSR